MTVVVVRGGRERGRKWQLLPSFSGLLLSFLPWREQKTPRVLSPAERGRREGEWAAESNQWWEKWRSTAQAHRAVPLRDKEQGSYIRMEFASFLRWISSQ